MIVRLNIFSGLPDPEWRLDPDSQSRLEAHLDALLREATHQRTSLPDQLGYRGIEIISEGNEHRYDHVCVYKGRVVFLRQQREIRDDGLERWLIETSPAIDASLRTDLLDSLPQDSIQ